jgi:hypothetical protein
VPYWPGIQQQVHCCRVENGCSTDGFFMAFSDFVHVASADRAWVVAAYDEKIPEVDELLAAALLT